MDNGAENYRRFIGGDDAGIIQIVSEYKDGLILFLNGYVKDFYIAEELTEETFFRLIAKKPKFSGKSSFKTWLYAIGRNVAVDYLRKIKWLAGVSVQDFETSVADESDIERSYIKEERKITIRRAIERLNPEYRQMLWLVYFEGFTNNEAARILKKNNRQISNLLYRAK